MNFLGKCEYSHGNFLNASCLYQSLYICLSSDNQGDSLTFGVVVLICLLGEGKIIWGQKVRVTKNDTCALKFGGGLVFLVCHGPRHFSSFFQNCTAD